MKYQTDSTHIWRKVWGIFLDIYINSCLYLAARKTMGFRFTTSFQTFPLWSPAPILNLRLSVSSYFSSCCCEGSQAVLLFSMVGRVNINLALWCGAYSWTTDVDPTLRSASENTSDHSLRGNGNTSERLMGLLYRFSVFINFLGRHIFHLPGSMFWADKGN